MISPAAARFDGILAYGNGRTKHDSVCKIAESLSKRGFPAQICNDQNVFAAIVDSIRSQRYTLHVLKDDARNKS